jgi:magnesium chelatase family protein
MIPRPGELSLANNGILFMDEFPEFPRQVLEVLRQPMEDQKVVISRANGSFTFPTSFICIAAMNPCPCGLLGHPEKPCRCSALQRERYRGKISSPLLDRIDLHIDVMALKYQEYLSGERGEPSSAIRSRVEQARGLQEARLGKNRTNGSMSSAELRRHCPLNEECQQVLSDAMEAMGISARACDRLLKVSRTIADLAGKPSIERLHLMEALAFRSSTLEEPAIRTSR